MLDIAFKNLWSSKLRSILCILGIMVCIFLINTVDGMLNSMRKDISQNLARYMGKITLWQKRASEFNSIIDEDIAKEALSLKGLNKKESTPLLSFVVVSANNPISEAEIAGLGIAPGKEESWLSGVKASSGKVTFVGEAKNSAILGWGAKEHYQASVGKKITILKRKVKVIGILGKTNNFNIDSVILVPLSFAQKVTGVNEKVGSILLTAKDLDQADKLAKSPRSFGKGWP